MTDDTQRLPREEALDWLKAYAITGDADACRLARDWLRQDEELRRLRDFYHCFASADTGVIPIPPGAEVLRLWAACGEDRDGL